MNIITINPLMQPVQYNGQTYFTGQYFHQMYRNNSDTNGKYKQTGTFIRLIRSIEAYQNYVEAGDIIEIRSKTDIKGTDTEMQNLHLAYKSNSYAPIMLINVTAQKALSHHLDDEISKQVSVAINSQQFQQADTMLQVARNHRARLQLAKMCGLKGNKALLAANSWTSKDDGVNILQSLGVDSLKDDVQSKQMTATTIGEKAGVCGNGQGKAQNVNLALWSLGYLDTDKNSSGKSVWNISEKGLKSDHLEYDDMEKEKGKRSSMQIILYRETLIPIIKEANLSDTDFKELKLKRKATGEVA